MKKSDIYALTPTCPTLYTASPLGKRYEIYCRYHPFLCHTHKRVVQPLVQGETMKFYTLILLSVFLMMGCRDKQVSLSKKK